MRKFLLKIANKKSSESYVTRLRKKRFQLFKNLVLSIGNESTKILDIGGTIEYWKQVYDIKNNPLNLKITLLNLEFESKDNNDIFDYVTENAKELSFENHSFDIVFSNSMIEHLGGLEQQLLAVNEMKRVAKYIYMQTPNIFFPIEPHFQILFIHWFLIAIRLRMLAFFQKTTVNKEYNSFVNNPINLLSKSDLDFFFDDDNYNIYKEKTFGLTKSFVVVSRLD